MGANDDAPESAFWDWSNQVYRKAGVADRLIALQDASGLNVNIVLWCVWTGLSRGRLKAKAVRRASAACADWADGVVAPIRTARKALKSAPEEAVGADALRKAIKKVELDAERIEQTMLEGFSPDDTEEPASEASALANLLTYRDAAESTAEDEAFEALMSGICAPEDGGD